MVGIWGGEALWLPEGVTHGRHVDVRHEQPVVRRLVPAWSCRTRPGSAAARTKHEVDVIALALGERPQAPRARIALIGEAKATAARRGTGDLQRLERIRALLTDQGYDTSGTTLALFSLHGFHPDLTESAAGRHDLLLVDLPGLYGIE
jgi:hypothetical protein